MAMMAGGAGLARVMPLLPWRSEKSVDNARYAMLGTTFVAGRSGTYWSMCPTPDHAKEGMYGKFVVRSPPAAEGGEATSPPSRRCAAATS